MDANASTSAAQNPDMEHTNQDAGSVPPSDEYEAVAKDRLYNRRVRMLGVRESLLRPPRVLDELTSGGWRPTRTRFELRWPDGEIDSVWYENVYSHLYLRVSAVAKSYFGYGDLQGLGGAGAGGGGGGGGKGLVWLDAGFSTQFMWFVEKVAMQDNRAGGWDELLVKELHRTCLVTGVIGKVLETCVFDDLLFGADEIQKKMLEGQDECTLELEGYQRTELRSQCVRASLADDLLTPDLWHCVDQCTLQLTMLLLPLVQMMDEHFPASQAKSLRSLYQDLHSIMATAGYLALGIRWSKNIFRFSQPFPGEVWDHDQQHVDDGVYKASAAASDKIDEAAEAKWKAERSRGQQEQDAGRHSPPTIGERGVAMATSVLNRLNGVRRRTLSREAQEDGRHGGHESRAETTWVRPSRLAKVQIVLWPCLKRYATVGEVNPATGSAEGEVITSILKAQVVYYCGRERELEGEGEHYPGLDDWVSQSRRERRWNYLGRFRWAAYAIGVWLLLCFLAQYSSIANDVQQSARNGLVEVATGVWREAVLFVMEVIIAVLTMVIGVVKLAFFLGHLSQGWRGKGFSLHPTNNTIGLSKPLLISRNTDGRGIGQKQHYTSDQWWLHAFDQKLKGLDTSKKGVVQSVTQGKLDLVASSQPNGKYTGVSGLYASFVRGGMLEGTMEVALVEAESTDATPMTSEDSEGSVSSKEKRGESKVERQARRAARRLRKAEKAARKAAESRVARKSAAKAAKKAMKKASRVNETKEERRARRAQRRARKEAKRIQGKAETKRKSDQG
ncbi:hypothetical protein C8A05DRAFT_40206 [Staphylotrichum tortipilum]|uniref:Uncharacterized protein n=1 Tax=Staphylotrichum tortipilum TaxID=2831512 RepID=A0AAN6RYE9_9PEZI|nr:hypothetical protein C8A05DRAFT_40206 [Staphylotrichum longicolle]